MLASVWFCSTRARGNGKPICPTAPHALRVDVALRPCLSVSVSARLLCLPQCAPQWIASAWLAYSHSPANRLLLCLSAAFRCSAVTQKRQQQQLSVAYTRFYVYVCLQRAFMHNREQFAAYHLCYAWHGARARVCVCLYAHSRGACVRVFALAFISIMFT